MHAPSILDSLLRVCLFSAANDYFMPVLVTGGAGFIGDHIAEHFQGLGEVLVLVAPIDKLRQAGFWRRGDLAGGLRATINYF